MESWRIDASPSSLSSCEQEALSDPRYRHRFPDSFSTAWSCARWATACGLCGPPTHLGRSTIDEPQPTAVSSAAACTTACCGVRARLVRISELIASDEYRSRLAPVRRPSKAVSDSHPPVTPHVRKGKKLTPAGWDELLGRTRTLGECEALIRSGGRGSQSAPTITARSTRQSLPPTPRTARRSTKPPIGLRGEPSVSAPCRTGDLGANPWIASDRVSPYARSSPIERTILDLITTNGGINQ